MSLPIETLSLCCEYLEYSHKPSCLTFSLVSKQWRAAALASLFRRIRIIVSRPEKLQIDVDRWLQVLQSNDSLRHVRRVEVEGCMRIATYDGPGATYTPWLKDYDEDDVFSRVPHYMENFIDNQSFKAVQENDEVWEPLAHLVGRLPGISDFVYAGLNSFSPCLLETLHNHRHDCRLHSYNFQLRSLQPPCYVDPFELKLATSPCLHSLRLRCESSGLTGDNMTAALQMASGLAPNLKRVSVSLQPSSGELNSLSREHRRPWEGFPGTNNRLSLGCGFLTGLELGHYGSWSQKVLEAWSRHSDLSALLTLKLRNDIGPEVLSWAALYVNFRSLTTLILDVDLACYGDSWTGSAQDAAASFLKSLPPLRALQVTADLGLSVLNAILERHGSALHRFWLSNCAIIHEETRPIATADQVRRIVRLCPRMEDLMLSIPRSKGDKGEVAIYRCLGQLPRLQRLALTLDCSDPHSESESYGSASCDEEDDQDTFESSGGCDAPRSSQIRSAFMNSALDGNLAISILRTISQSRPPGAFRLETLKLNVAGGSTFGFGINGRWGDSFFHDMLRVLGRSWLCIWHPRDDRKDEVVVTEIDQRAREEAEMELGTKLWEFEAVFRKIWPNGEEDDWRKDWQSLPLQGADAGVSTYLDPRKMSASTASTVLKYSGSSS